ncbi:Kinetochore protein Spc24 [Gnomoniopsis smithogilvyi]|uniref:Kinetochore protein Spc24 n=1 Tax=Gnomoniopsis smithogilvyi TaxID=1191159 RepID=A0A9W8YUG8_9PEZI|nr:Kinetochore protein Spc24 [Gnomoniopsis smithogilvyi]
MAKNTLFDEDDSGTENGFAETARGQELKINEEYARRFEHNKKRAEIHRLEEKYKTKGVNGDDEDDEDSSSDEDEDEDAFLATEELDAEISATLAAIKNKDPRIYDKDAKFFQALDENAPAPKEKAAKPMTLHDYHRERYMAGDTGADDEAVTDAPKTFVQEQADLKKELLAEIKAKEGSDDEDEDFIKSKPGQASKASNGIHPSREERIKPKAKDLDISLADKDPELYLSNFMASRAWANPDGSKWEAFESDEGEGNDDADEWETAYNLRFEDPAKSNEVLMSYSRKVVEARSVRREEAKGRKRQRELEKERKEEEKRQRHEERARLKRLKIEEAEEKLKKIKKAAGLKGKALKDDEWMKLLEDAWENDKWEEEMSKRFGDQYYAELEAPDSDEEADGGKSNKSKKPKKPKWDDDIDIKDIIPDFEDDEAKPDITLSDLEAEDEPAEDQDQDVATDSDNDSSSAHPSKKRKTTKALKSERQSAKRASRQERAKIEALVESQMELDDPTVLATSRKNQKQPGAPAAGFRYRETSPQTFGLTPRDILLAPSDTALNEFVGLKKLATFRDREKKQKDKKRLGKKARLREWRREVFGREFEHTGPTFGFSGDGNGDAAADGKVEEQANKIEGEAGGSKKKRKRSKGKKVSVA